MNKKTLPLILGAVALLITLFLVAVPEPGYQRLGLALALALIASFIGISILSSRRQHRALLRELAKVDNRVMRELAKVDDRVSRVEYRTQPVHDIRGSVVKTSSEVREALHHLRELASGGVSAASPDSEARPAGRTQPIEWPVFAPGAIRASAIESRPNMHTPGRDAARQEMNVPGERNLARILLAPESDLQREIAYIGGQDLIPNLESVGSVTVITPGMGEAAIADSTAYLVVDIASLPESTWRGTLDASRTHLFRELRTIILSARKKGSVVVLHGDDVPSHFTASLENLAHVQIRKGRPVPTRWGDDASSAVIDAIAAYDSSAASGEEKQRR